MENSKTVLVIEDEPRIRRAVKFMLQKRRYNVLEAFDGARGRYKTAHTRKRPIPHEAHQPLAVATEVCSRHQAGIEGIGRDRALRDT